MAPCRLRGAACVICEPPDKARRSASLPRRAARRAMSLACPCRARVTLAGLAQGELASTARATTTWSRAVNGSSRGTALPAAAFRRTGRRRRLEHADHCCRLRGAEVSIRASARRPTEERAFRAPRRSRCDHHSRARDCQLAPERSHDTRRSQRDRDLGTASHHPPHRRPRLRLIAPEGAGPDVALEVLGEGRGVLCDPIERGLDRAADRDAGALGGRAGAALPAAEAEGAASAPARSSSSSMSARRFR